MRRLRFDLAAAVALAVTVALTFAAGAQAAPPQLETGFSDQVFRSPDAAVRDKWLDRAAEARAGIVRINVSWSAVAASEPRNPRNPSDSAYDFSELDDGVRSATDRGLRVLLTIFRAPRWAEGPNRPSGAPAGSWRPKPRQLRDFGHAIARRYSGSFAGLPRVRHFQAWNEPNLSTYLTPQRRRGRYLSPGLYRRMLSSFHAGIHSAGAGNVVVGGGTAPYGDPKGPRRIRPLAFWRRVLCLWGRRSLAPRKCPNRARLDVLAHHPITTSGGPGRAALHHDDIAVADLRRLRRVLRTAERTRRVLPPGRRPLWVTEFWWQSNPPNTFVGVPVQRHARWIELAMYMLWRQGARVAINHLIRDGEFNPQRRFGVTATGVYFFDETAKPALRAFRFPFVARRRGPRRLLAWGRAPASGTLRIEVRARDGWRVVGRQEVGAGQVFRRTLALKRLGRIRHLRANVAGESSLVWRER